MFEDIRGRIAEGRWVLVGGWWVQADCNMPDGESFIRQALYGQRYFAEKFGLICRVGYNPDSFGHHAMLPQLLKKSGMDSYVFMRPGATEKSLDSNLFIWKSADGSEIVTCRIPFYTHIVAGELENALQYGVKQAEEAPWSAAMLMFGVGNHGGGPTKQNIETIQRWQLKDDGSTLTMSSPVAFFEQAMKETLPYYQGDLQMHAIGCYSIQAEVKKWNRQAEQLLQATEKFASFAQQLTGQCYPQQMDRAWKNVLFNQFHDILPGSGLQITYDRDARDAYGEAHSIAGRALNNALQSISWRINIPLVEGTKPIVVFNSHA